MLDTVLHKLPWPFSHQLLASVISIIYEHSLLHSAYTQQRAAPRLATYRLGMSE